MSNSRQGQRKSLEASTRAFGRLAMELAVSLCLILFGVARPAWVSIGVGS